MEIIIYIAIGALIIILAWKLGILSFLFSKKEEKLPYRRKEYLLSVNERKFYYALDQIARQNKFCVFSKVRLEDLLWIPKGTEERYAHRNRIKSRHVDFVICDSKDIKPLLVIELDDSSHCRKDRQERDKFFDEVFKTAGIPLLRFQTQKFYNVSEISKKISTTLKT